MICNTSVINGAFYYKKLTETFLKNKAFINLTKDQENILYEYNDLYKVNVIIYEILKNNFNVIKQKEEKEIVEQYNEKELFIFCIILLSVVICFIIYINKYPYCINLYKIFIFIFVTSIPWNWWHLYKMAIAKKISLTSNGIPKYCYQQDITIGESIKLFIINLFTITSTQDECIKYHQQLLVDPIYEISPTQVFAVTVTKLIITPLEYIGQATGKMINSILSELPIQLWPFALFIFMLFIVIFFNYKINICHLLVMEPLSINNMKKQNMGRIKFI